ncbi:MAG TPA: 50S ribosomal protein L10 [Candidatus Lokiarchaeia archaeon]|nr:50S ribosomal protein L10 [Candidatus Lokiarchaeia archaeon]
MALQREVSAKKKAEFAFLKDQIESAKVIGLVRMNKIGAKTIQEIRRQLRGKVVMRLSKKRIQARALRESSRPKLDDLANQIEGSSAMVFTDMDPMELQQVLMKNKVKAPARAGDVSPIDILVPAGNTGLPPGPIISELNETLKLQTKIQSGTVWIKDDAVTHKKGDVIDLKQSLLLARLGIEPIEIMLDFYAAWQDGEIIPRVILQLDVEAKKREYIEAQSKALSVAVALGILTEDTVKPMIQKAYNEACAVVLKSPEPIPGCEDIYAQKEAQAAAAEEASAAAPAAKGEDEKSEEEKQKDKSKMTQGLSNLFG